MPPNQTPHKLVANPSNMFVDCRSPLCWIVVDHREVPIASEYDVPSSRAAYAFKRIRTVANQVAEADDARRTELTNCIEHGVECFEVAVNVTDYGIHHCAR